MTETPRERPAPLRVRTDRPEAVYDAGEAVRFVVEPAEVSPQFEPIPLPEELPYTVTWDGVRLVQGGTLRRDELPGTVTVRPENPGFLRFAIQLGESVQPHEIPQAAAAVAPESIEPSLPVPDDFDEFWAGELAPQTGAPLEAQVVPHAEYPDGMVSNVRVAMPDGKDVYGWLLRPRGEGPFPAIVRYHGAGVYPVPPENGLDWTARGIMVFSINPHPIPNDKPREFYLDLRTGGLADYRTRGRDDRRTVYFREMFLRAARAVDFLASRPEWDGLCLIAEGHSQGGGQALAAAALNPKVRAIVVSCSTHCDHTGPVIGRVAGWPKLVELVDGVPVPRQVEAARYYDGVNFASRIRAEAFVSLGFLDDLCPPTGIYAAYNSLKGPKSIRHDVDIGHVHTDACKEAAQRWVEEYVRKR